MRIKSKIKIYIQNFTFVWYFMLSSCCPLKYLTLQQRDQRPVAAVDISNANNFGLRMSNLDPRSFSLVQNGTILAT